MRKILFFSLAVLLSIGAKVYAQGESESYVKISTAKAVGEKLELNVDRPVYLYWSNNNKTFLNGGRPTVCEVQTQDFQIRGEFEMLYCGANKLTSIESHVPDLKTLDCSNNLLTNLDLSGSPEIKWILCNNNKLKRLNVQNNTNIKILNFAFNEIRGKAMEELVASLCSSDKYKILSPVGTGEDAMKEGNVMMKKHIAIATSKGWKVGFLVGAGLAEYEGVDDAPYKKYKLTLNQAENGSIKTSENVNLNEIEEGTTLHIVATPKEGFVLDDLKANGEDIINTMLVTVIDNTTVEAMFVKDTGVETMDNNDFVCYPNPTTDILYIKLKGNITHQDIILSDIAGKNIKNARIDGQHGVIDLRNIIPGLYVLKIGTKSVKIIKK